MTSRKKIAVNTRFLIKGKIEGIGYFTQEILSELVSSHPEVDFVFLFDRKYDNSFIFGKNVSAVVLPPPARHPFLWYIWFEISVAAWIKLNKPDLLLSMDGFTVLNTSLPRVTVIHDLAFEHFPAHTGKLVYKYYKHFVPKYINASDRVVAVSEYTKTDISKLYDTATDKIDIVYNVTNNSYKQLTEEEREKTKSEYTTGHDYFVYVGSLHPRKNIKNLLLAFDTFKTKISNDCKLVIVGRKAWQYDDIEATYNNMTYKSDVIFTGHLPVEHTAQIVGAAIALCYVSFFEGFGIPIIEAQQCGVPVITSNVSSMPEVAADSAILVNPESVADISFAMQQLYSDNTLRNTIAEKGLENVKRFSADKSAANLWNTITQVLSKTA
jgi:glycosyltransferase involved in cell wall biosynthesis